MPYSLSISSAAASTFASIGALIFSCGPVYGQQQPAPAPPAEQNANSKAPDSASVGKAEENIIKQASDAFGTTIGRESIGIYSAGNVRGFSALAAGNARINGLFFDQVAAPTSRIRASASIKVGLSALGYPFPAPTGVVDHGLIRPQSETAASLSLSADSFGNSSAELDFSLPLVGEVLSAAGGFGLVRNEYGNGGTGKQLVSGGTLLWKPTPEIEVQPFWTRTDTYDEKIGPLYVTADGSLPPPIPRRKYFGQSWSEFEGSALLYGGLLKFASGAWAVDAGVFRSVFLTDRDTFVVLDEIGADRVGQYFVFTDPKGKTGATSGEIRLTRAIAEGPRLHRFIASVRARDRMQLFGGSDVQDLGLVSIGEVVSLPRPAFLFSEQSRNDIKQISGGLSYSMKWKGLGELSVGVSKTDYEKAFKRPSLAVVRTSSNPYLYNGTVAIDVFDNLAVYAGYARGLEENGLAPQSATNRNEALSAILTSQRDAGFRLSITPRLRLIAGIFDVRKPYFSRDETGLFTQLGQVRNRGLEVSLSGKLTDKLRVVAGGVALDPDVTGDGVALGRVGRRPVGLPKLRLNGNLDWQTPIDGVSLDLRIAYLSRRPATTLNTAYLPDRALVDIGSRYNFKLGSTEASLRFSVSNLFDKRGYTLFGSGTYDNIDGRTIGVYLAADF